MKHTTFEKFKELAKKGNTIPVYREILEDFETPIGLLHKLLRKQMSCFLLESVEQGENIGQFSFLGINPEQILYSKQGKTTVLNPKTKKATTSKKPILDVMKGMLKGVRFSADPKLPGCINGFVGYLSFEEMQGFEDISFRKKKREHTFDSIFFLSHLVIVFDHSSRVVRIVNTVQRKKTLKEDYNQAIRAIDKLIKVIQSSKAIAQKKSPRSRVKFKSNVGKQKFIQSVKKAKEYICCGDAIQIVYSHRFQVGSIKSPLNVYRAMRTINPSPYMFFFQFKDTVIVGSSPEVLVKLEKKKAIIRPIAGTRPRGKNAREDKKLEEDMIRSTKEMAEHLMLVDLSRNDIGRVCERGTVKVQDFAFTERYSHVMHLVSNVEGKIRRGQDAISLLEATFPAGTVSGAPKIRAMEIIDELEPVERGPYAGSLGYIGYSGDMDMCILIRTLFCEKKQAFVQAGAGIVYDSRPEKEYEETLNKAKGMFKAIELSREID